MKATVREGQKRETAGKLSKKPGISGKFQGESEIEHKATFC